MEQIKWYTPANKNIMLCGFPFYASDGVYRRLQLNPPKNLPVNVNIIANETAGGQIRLSACLKSLYVKVDLAPVRKHYWHMSDLAAFGFDCYVFKDGQYRYLSSAKFDANAQRYESKLFELNNPEKLDILLNFPLYCGVDKVMVGMDSDAVLHEPQAFGHDKRVVFYGSSIAQGACASRPGMCCTNILSRLLDMEVINLGFDSSGKAEAEVAEAVREIPDTAVLVISVEGNCPDNVWLKEKSIEFIRVYREKQHDTPIIILSFMHGSKDGIIASELEKRLEKRDVQKEIADYHRGRGDKNIYFVEGESFERDIFEGYDISSEQTADGLHLTDLGFVRKAKGLYGLIKKLI